MLGLLGWLPGWMVGHSHTGSPRHICIPFLPALASKVWTSLSFNYRGATRVSLVGICRRDMENSLEFFARAAAY
jgi:hypothetical protein